MDTKIIAEIGINHNGDINIAEKLIKESAMAGANFVKFQKRNPDICVPEHQKNILRDTPWGKLKYIDYKKKIEFGREEYQFLYDVAQKNNIELFFSVWDEDSLEFVLNFDSDYIKIPSALCTDTTLIKKAKQSGRTIIISTGMTRWDDILNVVQIFEDNKDKLVLMHCVSSYPTQNSYLQTISLLKEIHSKIGYSSHDTNVIIPASTTLLGAQIIEVHVTLDKNQWGSDHKVSLDINELLELKNLIFLIEENNTVKKNIMKEEYDSIKKLKKEYD